MRYPCTHCGQQRCRTHCRCARDGTASGLAMGRPSAAALAKATAKAQPKQAAAPRPAPAPLAVAPVGRASPLQVEVMDPEAWWTSLLQTVRGSTSIIVATYTYDHPDLTRTLLGRLADASNFDLLLLVDKEMFEARTTYHEHARLDSLRRGGATVELCRGHGPRGSFHKKILIADRRTAYLGSANFTKKSEDNDEDRIFLRGPPVQDLLRRLDQRRGTVWEP